MTNVQALSPEITHSPEQNRFYCDIPNAEESAQLLYQLDGSNIDFYRTYVPPEARGGKIAYRLVQQGIAWAEEQGYSIHASCWYVEKYLAARRSKD